MINYDECNFFIIILDYLLDFGIFYFFSYAERYELIKMSDVRLRNENEILKTLFMSNVMKAQFRNQLLLNECRKIVHDVDSDKKYKKEEEKRFKILKVIIE